MFGDDEWIESTSLWQAAQLQEWLSRVGSPLVVELGAGSRLPTVRFSGERMARRYRAPMIRINPQEANLGSTDGVSLPVGALAGLQAINEELCGL